MVKAWIISKLYPVEAGFFNIKLGVDMDESIEDIETYETIESFEDEKQGLFESLSKAFRICESCED